MFLDDLFSSWVTTNTKQRIKCLAQGHNAVPLVFFVLILYVPINNFSVMLERVFLDLTSTKQQMKGFAQGHNTVTLPV